MSRRIVVAMILSVLSAIVVGSIVKATEITIQWPIDNPVFTRTIVWDSNANAWAHTGVDTHGLDGQGQRLDNVPVKAVLGGIVTKVYYDSYCATVLTNCGVLLSGGWIIKIDHGNGWESRYAHLKAGSILVDADPVTELKTQVSAGEQIATSGNTGFYKYLDDELPYHLHFELRHKGAVVNPCDYLIGNVGGCGIDGTVATPTPTVVPPTPTVVPTVTPVPTLIPTPTVVPTPTPLPTPWDRVKPKGHYIDPPPYANKTLTVRAEVTDEGGTGVAWVRMSIGIKGGGLTSVEATHVENDVWEATYDVNAFSNGTVLNYLMHAGDNAGNTEQITGLQEVTIRKDSVSPTGYYVEAPTVVGASFVVRAKIEDPWGVSSARLHVNGIPQPMNFNQELGLWEAGVQTGGVLGTVFEYLIHATDGAGNSGQVTGSERAVVSDDQPPVGHGVVVNPRPENDLIIQVDFENDLTGIANATVQYRENGGGFQALPMKKIRENHWEAGIYVYPKDHGTKIEYLIFACDGAGNCGQTTGLETAIVVCPGVDPYTWCARYYPNQYFGGTPYTRAEGAGYIDRNYAGGSPDNGGVGVGADHFSVRWSKRAKFTQGTYTFRTRSDDGARVRVDGVTVIDSWRYGGEQRYEVPVTLSAEEHVIALDYFEGTGLSYVSLSW